MQSPLNGRKRPAPGAAPINPQSQSQSRQQLPAYADDQYNASWNSTGDLGALSSAFTGQQQQSSSNMNQYSNEQFLPGAAGSIQQQLGGAIASASSMNTSGGGDLQSQSSQLVRRNMNNQLAAQRQPSQQQNELMKYGNAPLQGQPVKVEESDNEEDLEQRALYAKKDALAKRKQIPPFVQKLGSFLDDPANSTLIRWSSDGLSFVVLDEEEFAKRLIPELFKHNRYSSFVRQLNMYGFHKRVGLSDNSMRNSEQNVKHPSEYYHKYFRRGRPELLWLIQKPKSLAAPAKRKREGEKGANGSDSDGDHKAVDRKAIVREEPASAGNSQGQELVTLPKSEILNFQKEIKTIQQQQKWVNEVLLTIRQQHDQLYQQAANYQSLHDRHESSINAILTFLATFYNRSLEKGRADIGDMFQMPRSQAQGNVFPVAEVAETEVDVGSPLAPSRQTRKPLALLPAPDSESGGTSAAPHRTSQRASGATTRGRSSQNSSGPSAAARVQPVQSPVESLEASNTASPSTSKASPSNDKDMISVINTVNANNTARNNNKSSSASSPSLDFSAALNHIETAEGASPLTPQKRTEMLTRLANDNSNDKQSSVTTNLGSQAANIAAALTTSNPPPIPSLADYTAAERQLEYLQHVQEQQTNKVQALTARLSPLSPTGSIPGLERTHSTPSIGFDVKDFDLEALDDPTFWDLDSGVNPTQIPGEDSGGYFNVDNPIFDNADLPSSNEAMVGALGDAADGGGDDAAEENKDDNERQVQSLSPEGTLAASSVPTEEAVAAGSPTKRRRR